MEGRLDRRSGGGERPDQHEIVSHGEVLDGLAIDVHLWVLWIAVVVCRDFIGIKPWRFALAVERLGADLLAAMIPYFRNSFANPHSSDHSLRWESSHAVEDAAARVARLIGAGAEEITFTSGATESTNLALLGLGRRVAGGKRRRILISAIEHTCVLAVGRVLKSNTVSRSS